MVVFGHKIAKDHWYRDTSQGSRIAGNCSHWIDLVTWAPPLAWRSLVWPLTVTSSNCLQNFLMKTLFYISPHHVVPLITISSLHKLNLILGVTESITFHSSSLTANVDNFQSLRIDTGSSVIYRKSKFKNASLRCYSSSICQ